LVTGKQTHCKGHFGNKQAHCKGHFGNKQAHCSYVYCKIYFGKQAGT